VTKRGLVGIVLGVLVLLVALRAGAPYAIEYYANERFLNNLGDYSGRVEDVDLALWRGAFRVEQLRIRKATGKQQVDFLYIPVTEASISRRALLNGAIRMEAVIDQPEINFVDAEKPEDEQYGKGFNWQVIPEDFFKFALERVEIRRGTAAFRNFTSKPPVNIQAKNIDLVATNLSNIEEKTGELVATANVSADLFNESPLTAKAEFNPLNLQTFIFAGEADIKDITKVNDFAKAYANLDFKRGEGEVVMELKAENGQLTGYLKPMLGNLEIADWQQDVVEQEDNPLRVAWEGIAGFVSALVSNQETDALATRVEITGDIPEGASVDVWQAVVGILRNAVAEAIDTNFDHLTPLDVPEPGADDEAVATTGEE
jgi:hypothetical protein